MADETTDPPNYSEEVFTADECELFWLLAKHHTAEEAVACVASLVGPFDLRVSATLVTGRIEFPDGEPFFTLDEDGDDEAWEVEVG